MIFTSWSPMYDLVQCSFPSSQLVVLMLLATVKEIWNKFVLVCRWMQLWLPQDVLLSQRAWGFRMYLAPPTQFFALVLSNKDLKDSYWICVSGGSGSISCLDIFVSMQVKVETQRGFVPVDERMCVLDVDGNLVWFLWSSFESILCCLTTRHSNDCYHTVFSLWVCHEL